MFVFDHLIKLFTILLVVLSLQKAHGQSSLGYVEGDVIIKFKESPASSSVRQSLSGSSGNVTLQGVSDSVNLTLQNSFNNFSMQHYRGIEESQSTEEIIEQLENHPDIEYIEPNYIISKTSTDTDIQGQSSNNPDSIFARAARNAIQTSNNNNNETIKIAVLDTGTDITHSDLQGVICNNTGEVPNDGNDNDGNGFADDVNGWNFADSNGDLSDCDGHGTHVSGIIEQIVIGDTTETSAFCIMPLKFLGCDGIGSTSNAINAIDYAIDNEVRILNNSWGNESYSNALHDAVTRSYDAGVVFVAAAGNNASNNDIVPFYPASYPVPHVISVAAITFSDSFAAAFSNYGTQSVHIGAPGVNVQSAYPDNQNVRLSGTSMATPYVSGVTGLMLYAQSELNGYEVKQILLESAEAVASLNDYVQDQRRLDALRAVLGAQGQSPSFVLPEYSNRVFSSSSSAAGGCGLVHKVYSNLHQMKSYKKGGNKGQGDHLPKALFGLMLALPLMVWLYLKQKATTSSKRKYKRYEVDIPLHLALDNHFISANLFSISQSGAGISISKSTHQLKRGSQVDLLLSKYDEDVTLSGKIVWMSENKIGVEFKEKATWITKFTSAHSLSTSKNI